MFQGNERTIFPCDLVFDPQSLAFTNCYPLLGINVKLFEWISMVIMGVVQPTIIFFQFNDRLTGGKLVNGLTLDGVADWNAQLQGSLLRRSTESERSWNLIGGSRVQEQIDSSSDEGVECWNLVWGLKSFGGGDMG